MVLQFNPPSDLVNAYMNRPNPGLQVVDSLGSVAQAYLQHKSLQQQQSLAQQAKDVEMAKGLSAGGQDFSDAYNKIVSGRNAPQSIPGNQSPSLIDRAKSFFGAGPVGKTPVPDDLAGSPSIPPTPSTGTITGILPTPTNPTPPQTNSPQTDPAIQEYMQVGSAEYKRLHGSQGLDKLKTALEIDKGLQDKAPKPDQPVFDRNGNKLFTVPANARIEEPPQDGTDKENKRQDELEKQYRNSFIQVRGDKSLQRAEEQRDAASTVYNRIQQVKDHGQILNPVDYVDSLGQIYKARTGQAPGLEVLAQARQATAKGDFGKAFTYLIGEQAPATTKDIMDSLQEMALSMGQQADKFHEGYMRSRVRPPSGLAHDRVSNVNAERGMSFAEATGQGPIPLISNDSDFSALPSGAQFKDPSGALHRKK